MTNQWALVTGARGAIGARLCEALTSRAVSTVGLDRAEGRQAQTCDTYYQIELADEDKVKAATRELIAARGAPQFLASVAGTYKRLTFQEYDLATANQVVEDNFLGPWLVTQQVLPEMIRSGSGRVVFVGSQAATRGGTDTVYAGAKAALTTFAKCIAREYAADGIRANVVSPGPVDTPMADVMGDRVDHYLKEIPIGRFSEAAEVANAVCWLLLDAPDAINGATVDIDGGLIRR